MQILRFMDSLQHDYGANPILFVENAPSRFGGRDKYCVERVAHAGGDLDGEVYGGNAASFLVSF